MIATFLVLIMLYRIAPHERSLTARRTSVPWEEAGIAQSPYERWICMKII
jgi:hypothetical protein